MVQIIDTDSRVKYGSIDEPLEWNIDQYKLKDIFEKEIKGVRRRWAYHQFNYIGILNPEFVCGIAVVDLGYAYNIFSFYYDQKKGMQFHFDKKGVIRKGRLQFDRNPDSYILEYKDRSTELMVLKSHEKGALEVHCNFKSSLIINAVFDFSMQNTPLRVCNPASPTRWSFTEKCSPLKTSEIDLCLNGSPVPVSKNKTFAIYDWSGGYMDRNTNWFWSSLGGLSTEETPVGANFAALVNESFYPENGYWIDGERTRMDRIIFDFNPGNPYESWDIHDEKRERVNLVFRPHGERSEKMNRFPFSSINFRQFIGSYSGWLKNSKGKKVHLEAVSGFTEIHQSIW